MIFQWDEDNVGHIAEHGVSPDEAEYVVKHAAPPFPRAARDGKFMVWGRTDDGSYLQVGFVPLPDERVDIAISQAERTMMNATKTKRAKLSPMKAMRLAEASKALEGIRFDQTRDLTPAERVVWDQATRGPGRPRKPAGEKAARVLVTIPPKLLAAADAYAQRRGISRAELFARGITAVLSGGRSARKTG